MNWLFCATHLQSRTACDGLVRRLLKLEFQIMESLWNSGSLSIREVQEGFPEKRRPAYTTIQTTVYRLEGKGAVHRAGKSVTSISLSRA